MWISKEKYQSMEKKIADLEKEIQSQQKALYKHLNDDMKEMKELKRILVSINHEFCKGEQQILKKSFPKSVD